MKLHMRAHNWRRALALATQLNRYVDLVLWRRQRYLQGLGVGEQLEEFVAAAGGVALDVGALERLVAEERRKVWGEAGK